MIRWWLAVIFVSAALSAAPADFAAKNLGFEAWNDAGRPEGWMFRPTDDYVVAADCEAAREGRCALRLESTSASQGSFQPVGQQVPIAGAGGHVLKLSGFIRTRDVSNGWAGFWMRVDARGRPDLVLENMEKTGPRGTTDWQRFEISVPVAPNAATVSFGALLAGTGAAWFDDIRLTVDESVVVAAVALADRPEPSQSLMGDRALALKDADLPKVDADARADVRRRAHPLRSLWSDDFADLQFLKPLLRGKRIVQLGESGHGVAEFNWLKVRLVKFLHRELGFDVVAFESSLGGCELSDQRVAAAPAVEVMRGCIFGVWHTSETLALFEYLEAERRAGRRLSLAGFDVQNSGTAMRDVSARLARYAARIDAELAKRIDNAEKNLTRADAPRNAAAMRAAYAELAEGIARRSETLREPSRPMELDIVAQEARSRLRYVEELVHMGTKEGAEARDAGMADNLDFLADRMFAGRKIVVWAHNYHIAKRHDHADPPVTMGVWVARRRAGEVYTIGLYMGHGVATWNDRSTYDILAPADDSLEAVLANAGWKWSFVDLSASDPPEWMGRSSSAREWGTTPRNLRPTATYDGVIYIDAVTPPQYR